MARKQKWKATNSAGYESPAALGVDDVVLTVQGGRLVVLTVERPEGGLALPGGFVGRDEAPAATALRKLEEKTGVGDVYLEQLATFADPGRDPRGWIPAIAYLALVPPATEATDPAARWVAVDEMPALAFDHDAIVSAALERVRGKLWWSNVAVGILPAEFPMSAARQVYEAIAGTAYDPATFARDLRATGLIEPTGAQRQADRGRPASMWRFRSHAPEWGEGRRKRIS